MPDRPDLILVDGSSYLFRAFHALPPLANSRGEPTGAIVGVVNMLRKLINDYQPKYMAVVFDAPGKTFRDDLYDRYKANRPPTPEDLKVQIDRLHDIVRAMGLPLLVIDDVEADDVIGTLTRQAAELGMSTLVSTGDKDMAQLVNEHVSLIDTMSNRYLDEAGVEEKFGVKPEQIIDYLALMGDASDNIPGVPKCGPKTAAKWLAQYESIDRLVSKAEEIRGKIGENLRAFLPQLPLSRQLTTIKTDVALDVTPQQLQPQAPDVEKLSNLYKRIESNRLLETLEAENTELAPESAPVVDQEYTVIFDEMSFEESLQRLQQSSLFAFDTETTSLEYMQAELVGLSFSTEPGKAVYVPVAHRYPGAPPQLDRDWVLEKIKPLLEDPEQHKVGQHMKYDMNVLANYGIHMQGIRFDTMLESYVLDSTATRHDMDSLAKKYLGAETVSFTDIAGKGAGQLTFDQIELEQAGPYAAEDADITLRLHQALWPQLEQIDGLRQVYMDIEIPLVPVLSRMERTGVRIDAELLLQQSQELAGKLHELEQRAHGIAGHAFNLGSPKQIGHIFFEELGMDVVRKTPKGAPSTSEEVLQILADKGEELPAVILEHRGLAKLKNTYVDKLPEMRDANTGRVHTSYHQAVAATGRLSSSDPNLQNIPVRTEEGRRIRKAFIAEPGSVMLAADYSQIELRIMAHLSGDQGLLTAFSQGLDIHRATAAEVFAVDSAEAVSDAQRRSAKAINFGLIYGMSAFGLAKQLGIGRQEAQEYVDLYFQRYPGVQAFMDKTREQAHEDGYVETLFGRRLYLPEINARNGMRRAAAERTAINAPMQGTAADIIKRAMISMDAWLETDKPPVRMVMQVHDELVFEVQKVQLDAVQTQIRTIMESAAKLKVPLVVDVGIGDNWEEAH
jgi:DNA polymerase-1